MTCGIRTFASHSTNKYMTDLASPTQTPFESEIAALIVRSLSLDVAASDVAPEAPLYGEGLGLDSIDILELALAIAQTYKVQTEAGDPKNLEIYKSLRALAAHVAANRPVA